MLDTDGDGFGDANPTSFYDAGSDCNDTDSSMTPMDNDGDGFSTCDGDCNDTDSTIFPGATEIYEDGIDQDCNGQDDLPTCYYVLYLEDSNYPYWSSCYINVYLDGNIQSFQGMYPSTELECCSSQNWSGGYTSVSLAIEKYTVVDIDFYTNSSWSSWDDGASFSLYEAWSNTQIYSSGSGLTSSWNVSFTADCQ